MERRFDHNFSTAVVALSQEMQPLIEAEQVALNEFLNHNQDITKTKKLAQHQIYDSMQWLKQLVYADLIVPGNLQQFLTVWEQFETHTDNLQAAAHDYSFCLKAFADYFMQVARSFTGDKTMQMVRQIEKYNEYLVSVDDDMRKSEAFIYVKVNELLVECRKEVDRFVEEGAVDKRSPRKVINAESISDFMLFYSNVCAKEKECFDAMAAFMNHHEKDMEKAAAALERAKEVVNRASLTDKDKFTMWISFQPHMKVLKMIMVAGFIASFFSEGILIMIFGKRIMRALNSVAQHKIFRMTQKAASYVQKYEREINSKIYDPKFQQTEEVPVPA